MARGRRNNETGASLVESALILPILLLLVFGLIDGSILLKGYLSVGYAAQAGARADTARANQAAADYELLQAIKKSRYGLDPKSIERIIVFKAASFDDAVPAACVAKPSGGIPGKCNVYVEADTNRPIGDFGAGSWSGDKYWPASDRSASRASSPDLVGVAVIAKVSTPTNIFGKDKRITRVSIMQIEARTR